MATAGRVLPVPVPPTRIAPRPARVKDPSAMRRTISPACGSLAIVIRYLIDPAFLSAGPLISTIGSLRLIGLPPGKQPVMACGIGHRRIAELRPRRYRNLRHRPGPAATGGDVEDEVGIADAGRQRLGTGGGDRLETVIPCTGEDAHHLLAAIPACLQALPHRRQRCRQMPGPERRATRGSPRACAPVWGWCG